METGKSSVKRLGIYTIYDKDGIIDDYIPYLLHDIRENLEELVVVVNGRLTDGGRERLNQCSDRVCVRENEGFDFCAWKYVLTEVLGWDEVSTFDELVLFNDSFFGPLYPFREVFEKMESHQADFWGLTVHGEAYNPRMFGKKRQPAFVQSYFVVVRRSMLTSDAFRHFWENLPSVASFDEAVIRYEVAFTSCFAEQGFTYGAYIPTCDLDNEKLGAVCNNHYSHYELLKRGFPVMKRKVFFYPLQETLTYHNGEDIRRCLKFVRENTAYDERMIFQHILRNRHIYDVYATLHLQYVLCDKAAVYTRPDPPPRVLVILHLYYMDILEEKLPYLKAIPEYMDVLITTKDAGNLSILESSCRPVLGERLHITTVEKRGRDNTSLLVAAKPYMDGYDYICYLHDKKSSQMYRPTSISFERLLWENMLCSREYIENIIGLFESEPSLGLLLPPPQLGGYVDAFRGGYWTTNLEETQKLAERIKLKAIISQDRPVLSVGNVFWARTKALKPLLNYDWSYEEFDPDETIADDGTICHALERILAYVAQDAGFYTGLAITPEFASVEINDLYFLAQQAAPIIGLRGALKMYLKKHLPNRS